MVVLVSHAAVIPLLVSFIRRGCLIKLAKLSVGATDANIHEVENKTVAKAQAAVQQSAEAARPEVEGAES